MATPICIIFGCRLSFCVAPAIKTVSAPKIMVEDLAIFNDLDKYMKLPLESMKKFFKIFLIILFPLGILYCVGTNLFNNKNFAGFLGGIFLFVIGFLVSIFVLRPDITQSFLSFFGIS